MNTLANLINQLGMNIPLQQRITILKQIVDYGVNTLNLPLANKYIDELIKINPNDASYRVKRIELNIFLEPESTKEDFDFLEKINFPNLKILKQQYFFAIKDYKKAEKLTDNNFPQSIMFKEFSKALRTNKKLSFQDYPQLNTNPEFFKFITERLEYFKLNRLLQDWFYFGKKQFPNEKEFLQNIEARINLNKANFNKIDPTNLFPEIKKCFYLATGDYENYWLLRKSQTRTIVNMVSSFNLKEYKKDFDLENKTILITTSEGFGDNIMSLRYLEEFAKNNIKIKFLVLKQLKPLFQKLLAHHKNIKFLEYLNEKDTKKIGQVDYYLYLTEMASELDIKTEETVKELGEKYQYPIGNGNKVLINWKTSARNIDTKQRSFSLEEFLKHIDKSEELITVQFDLTEKEKSILEKYNIQHIEVNNFLETYEVLSQCKKIYTNDTVMAHLAGITGKETVMLLKDFIDCKFLKEGKHYLYPNLTIKRTK